MKKNTLIISHSVRSLIKSSKNINFKVKRKYNKLQWISYLRKFWKTQKSKNLNGNSSFFTSKILRIFKKYWKFHGKGRISWKLYLNISMKQNSYKIKKWTKNANKFVAWSVKTLLMAVKAKANTGNFGMCFMNSNSILLNKKINLFYKQ